MNRISLYEAIRRQKEKQGLTPPPKAGSSPVREQRTEYPLHLKQTPVQAKPVVPVKPVVKSPIKPLIAAKSSIFKREKKDSWQFLALLKKFVKNNPATVWIGIGGGVIVLILVIFLLGIQSGQNPAGPTQENVLNNNKTRPVENINQQKTQNQTPVLLKQEEKPLADKPVAEKPATEKPVAEKPVVTEKKVETPKSQPKAQLPAAIQEQLQKQADTGKKPQPPAPASVGDHIIVIVAYTKPEHLSPVEVYFRQNGIETEVVRQGSYYLLVTKQRFENPERTGTDGYKMKQTIKRIGAGYKAPDGYERFSSTPFQDVYGKKVK